MADDTHLEATLEQLAGVLVATMLQRGETETTLSARWTAAAREHAVSVVEDPDSDGVVVHLLTREQSTELGDLVAAGLPAIEATWIVIGATRQCIHCAGVAAWVDAPGGGWWAHDIHPTDGHDAQVVS